MSVLPFCLAAEGLLLYGEGKKVQTRGTEGVNII